MPPGLASPRRLCLPYFVLDPTKPQAPVWRENFGKPVGKKLVHCGEDGRRGLPEDCLTRSVRRLNNHNLLFCRGVRYPEARSQNTSQIGNIEITQDTGD